LLVLGPHENEYIPVTFESKGIHVHIKPYLYTDENDLIMFFRSLAKDWKGWDGIRLWKSIEGDLQFEVTHDHLGFVNVKLLLIKNQGFESEWSFRGKIQIELGALENIASDVANVFSKR